MYQRFSPDLATHEIYANGIELALHLWQDRDTEGNKIRTHPDTEKMLVTTIQKPVLVSDTRKVMQIKEYATRETANLLIQKPKKITEYDGMTIEFDQQRYGNLWWPNIDTLLFCKWLRTVDFSNIHSATEIWCGSSCIAKYILTKAPHVRQMDLYDINPFAQQYFNEHMKEYYPQATFHLGDAKENLAKKTYDLIVCNPPYIPRPNSIEDNAYEWLELLIHLITNAKNLLNPWWKLIVNISSLSDSIITPILNDSELRMKKITSLKVPLKVFNVINTPERVYYLKEHHGLQEKLYRGHKYRQQLDIIEITLPQHK